MKLKHNYKNLKIWKKALYIAFDTSDILEAFSQKEQCNLTSQMSRCSISIPSNIAEGSSRTDKSFNHFLDISSGSSYKLSTQLLIAHHKKYSNDEELEKLENNITEWQMMTSGFQNPLG
ncbi:four helix bundle protein [Aequorivita sp. F47161]|uniref:Four helix bundle protein n=1 Tax=Aequorivita vitellina TaxID=2874475 RepID=A0A9X1QWA3_9FLAO|nr:four helix bundle protein [Aequorivita vitellina]MCG2419004.1 four helix bundle protein [Aequorivita vitellina]